VSTKFVLSLAVLPWWLLAVGCSSLDPVDPGPTTVTLTADRTTATAGQDIEFSFSATGSSITALHLDYGDGESEDVGGFGALTMSGRRTHAYLDPGSYTVTATLEDAITGNVTDDMTVQITASSSALETP
jgi:PKD repeat protein